LKHDSGASGCVTDPEDIWNAGAKGAAGLKAERNENRFNDRSVKSSNEEHKCQLLHRSSFLGCDFFVEAGLLLAHLDFP
jgi:hypothetical protein